MQFKNILALALAGVAAAAPMVQDLPTVLGAVNAVSSALTTFDTAVKALGPSADPKVATTELNAKGAAILTALQKGATSIQATSALTLTEAIQLSGPSGQLSTAAGTTVDDLIAKKPLFDASGQSATVLKQLQDQQTANKAFIDALLSKLPSAVRSIASTQANQASSAIARGIQAFTK